MSVYVVFWQNKSVDFILCLKLCHLNHCLKLKQIRIRQEGGVRYERDKETGKGLREEDSNPPPRPPGRIQAGLFHWGFFFVIGGHLRVSKSLCSELVYFFRITPSRIYPKVCWYFRICWSSYLCYFCVVLYAPVFVWYIICMLWFLPFYPRILCERFWLLSYVRCFTFLCCLL